MEPIGSVGPARVVGSRPAARQYAANAPGAPSPQRALVLVAPSHPSDRGRRADGRAAAPFLAHLIATAEGVPQTRERRRAEPNWASATYAAAMEIPEAAGHLIRTSR